MVFSSASICTNFSIRRCRVSGRFASWTGVLDPIEDGVAVLAVKLLEEPSGLRLRVEPGTEVVGHHDGAPGRRGVRTRSA
jgi:hypothetical protein